jgi:hypothetical protein
VRRTASRPRTSKTPREGAGPEPPRTDPAVTEFLRVSKHPLRKEIEVARRIIREASPAIREGIKWNAPSFRTTDWFATLNGPRATDGVLLILHFGAKPKGIRARGNVADPAGLLRWLADDRCLVTFADGADVEKHRAALQAIVRAWIRLL